MNIMNSKKNKKEVAQESRDGMAQEPEKSITQLLEEVKKDIEEIGRDEIAGVRNLTDELDAAFQQQVSSINKEYDDLNARKQEAANSLANVRKQQAQKKQEYDEILLQADTKKMQTVESELLVLRESEKKLKLRVSALSEKKGIGGKENAEKVEGLHTLQSDFENRMSVEFRPLFDERIEELNGLKKFIDKHIEFLEGEKYSIGHLASKKNSMVVSAYEKVFGDIDIKNKNYVGERGNKHDYLMYKMRTYGSMTANDGN